MELAPRRAAVVLGSLIAVSIAFRSITAWGRSIPRFFPDEYIYAALGRSLGHGHLAIRGETVHFPGILEPILAAPIWRLAGLQTAYHLVQVENAVAASLAAIPVYLLARSLRIAPLYALVAAAYALLVPELVLIGYTSSDAVAYPLALGAVAAGIAAVDSPSRRNQLLFLAFAGLAVLARVEYVALAPAYVIAALVVDGKDVWRRQRLVLAMFVPAGAVALAAATTYYSLHLGTWFSVGFVEWFFIQLFLLAIEFGVVAAPGAVAGLTAASGRREKTFVIFAASLGVVLLAEASRVAAETSAFKERYLFVLLALAPVSFCLYVKNRRPRPAVVIGVAAAIIVAAARLPLSSYAASTFKIDSYFLVAVSDLQDRIGTDNGSLVIALMATAAALLAIAVAYRGGAVLALLATCLVAGVVSASAIHADLQTTRRVRASLPDDLSWVDKAASGPVTAVETPRALKQDLLYQLYWNPSIDRELLLGNAIPTDAFSAPRIEINRGGAVLNASGDILFHDYGATALFADARRIRSADRFTLWRPSGGAPRLLLIVDGRFFDGWLAPSGRLRAWPQRGVGVRVSFRLSVPSGAPKVVRVTIAGSTFTIRPGGSARVVCTSAGPFDAGFTATGINLTPDLRPITARMTRIAVEGRPVQSRSQCAP